MAVVWEFSLPKLSYSKTKYSRTSLKTGLMTLYISTPPIPPRLLPSTRCTSIDGEDREESGQRNRP